MCCILDVSFPCKASHLYSLHGRNNQPEWCVHGHTYVVVGTISDGRTVCVYSAVEDGMVGEGQGDCLDENWHVGEGYALLGQSSLQ